jgi:hypothetical protein
MQALLDWNATPETDAATAAPVRPPAPRHDRSGPRWYIRCRQCLSIAAVDEPMNVSEARCGACNGAIETMGQVHRDRLVYREIRSACDDRCTNARGPLCDCSCGGKNHGSHRVVIVLRDAGPIPRVMMPGPTTARAIAQEFHDGCAAVLAQLDSLRNRRRAGEFLPRSDFDRLRRLDAALLKAHAARTHAGRMKTLRDALAPERSTRP